MHVFEAGDAHIFLGGAEAERLGDGGCALQDEVCAALHTRGPLRGAGGTGAQHEDPGGGGGLRHESDGLQEQRPAALVVG